MKKTNKIIMLVVLIAIMLLGIGYAAIQNITLNIGGTANADPSQANFSVKFTGTPVVSDTSKVEATITDNVNATINVEGLTNKGEIVTAEYLVQNASEDLSTDLVVESSNSNEEYFLIQTKIGKTSLSAGEETTVIITVELIKVPIEEKVTSTIGVTLTAKPVQPGEEGKDNSSTGTDIITTGLKGKINSDEFQISLDATHWVNTIDFEDFLQTNSKMWTMNNEAETIYLDDGKTFQNPAENVTNVMPSELLSVSTTGTNEDGIGKKELVMYGGTYTESEGLKNITVIPEDASTGYLAFDLYLMNTGVDSISSNILQLKNTSRVTGNNGIQNAIRVAFALYENDGETLKIGQMQEPTSNEIIEGTSIGKKITDIAIWEPNADKHTDDIVNSSANTLKLTTTDSTKYGLTANASGISKFTDGKLLPTYALTSASKAVGSIANIYDWTEPSTGLGKQNVTATKEDDRTEDIDLISVTDGITPISIKTNQYQKMRIYVWMEGQDPDCSKTSTSAEEITLNVEFSKK